MEPKAVGDGGGAPYPERSISALLSTGQVPFVRRTIWKPLSMLVNQISAPPHMEWGRQMAFVNRF